MESLRWPKGGMNLDDSVELMDVDDWSYALNAVQGRSTSSKNMETEVTRGTTLLASPSVLDTNSRFIGKIRSGKNDNFLFFYNSDPSKHCIVRHKDDVFTVVMAWSGLNFINTKSSRINGGGLAGDILYWTDDTNEPRCINITRYLASTPLSTEEILLIRRGPQIPPTFTKNLDGPLGEDVESNLINYFEFQFAYQYQYEDGQLSVLSPYSGLCAKSVNDEDYRRIRITVSATESVPAVVDKIIVCARIGNNGTFFRIGELPGDGSVKDFDFYNTTNGNVIESVFEKPFELVPRRVKTMSLSKSRLWLGNYLEGYDTPTVNMSASILTASVTLLQRDVFRIRRVKRVFISGMWQVVEDFYVDVNGVFYFTWTGASTYDMVDYNPGTYVPGVTVLNVVEEDVENTFISEPEPFPSEGANYITYTWEVEVEDALIDNPGSDVAQFKGKKTFPSQSTYKLGIVFSDDQGRKSGVYTDDGLIVDIASEFFHQINVKWTLNDHSGIPSWARYYSVVITKNLKKSYFIETQALGIHYSETNAAGTEVKTGSYSKEASYLKLNIKQFPALQIGYAFVEGDRVFVRDVNGIDYDLQIKGFDGSYVLAESKDIGVVGETTPYSIEIYRPITNQYDIFFYEQGQVFPVVDSQFSQTTGIFFGDCVNVVRPEYSVVGGEVAAGADTVFKAISLTGGQWNTDAGRPFVEVEIGEVWKKTAFRHSSPFIAEAEVNGLSEFNTGDEGFIATEAGEIQKLQATTKESTEGDVLLAICNSDTYSIYIGESRLASGDQSFIVASPKVIGDVRKQRSGFGTLHPESVVEENGYVYWYDKLSRAYVRYASNGIFPISEYKVVSYFEDVSELNGVDDAVISGYDPYYKMVFVTFPNNPVQGKTIGFSLTKDRWISFYGFKPSAYFCDGTKMFSITDGNIWSHTAEGSGYNIFYVITNSTEIVLSFNDAPDQPKEWRVVQVQMSPTPFSYVNGDQVLLSDVLRVEMTNRNGQFTSVRYYEFEVDENMAYADIRCDEFSSGGLIEGVPMYSNTLQVKVKISGSSYKTFTMAKIGFDPSLSHSL